MEKRHALYLFLDDIREADIPSITKQFKYYCVAKHVNRAKYFVLQAVMNGINEIWFDLDHDLGDYAS